MTTAIIGIGNIGSRVARNLVQGGEQVVLASRDQSGADKLAAEVRALASSASVVDAVSQADAVLFAVWLDTEKELISHLSEGLVGKVVIDPSNPIGPDGHGGFTTTLPEGQSAASILASLLPAGAHFVKAFGTLGAGPWVRQPTGHPDGPFCSTQSTTIQRPKQRRGSSVPLALIRSKPEESRRPADWKRCEATFTKMAGSVESC